MLLARLLLLLALPASAGYLPYTKEALPNGLVVILHEDRSIPVVAVNTWVKTGAADEKAGETGRAHLFEHFMFEGSEHIPQGAFDSIVYAMGGTNNAWTGVDETNYYTLVPSNGLGEALRLESDRLGYLRGAINPEALKKQIGIVVNELRERRDGPYAEVPGETSKLLWPEGHPARNSPGGEIPDVESTAASDAAAFHRKFYNPNNVILSIAGDFDPAEAMALVRRWYGGIPRGPAAPPRRYPPFAKLPARAAKTISDPQARRESVVISFRIPDPGHPDYEKLSLLTGVLGGNDAWGMRKALVNDAELARGVSVNLSDDQRGNSLRISADAAAGVTPARLERALLDHVRSALSSPFPPRALPALKSALKAAILGQIQKVQDRAVILASGEANFGEPAHFEAALLRLLAYTEEELRAAGAEYLDEAHAAVLTVVPAAPAGGRSAR